VGDNCFACICSVKLPFLCNRRNLFAWCCNPMGRSQKVGRPDSKIWERQCITCAFHMHFAGGEIVDV
jgi:hypothetical protein